MVGRETSVPRVTADPHHCPRTLDQTLPPPGSTRLLSSRLHAAALSVALVASLALAGCSDDATKGSEPDAPRQTLEDGTVISATWPLTGLEATGDEEVALKRPVLVTKMDNTPSSAPQVGLSSADLVVEEVVEGGVTRLAAFFYSELPETVGPVRSMRASDMGFVPEGYQIVTSGGAPQTVQRIKEAGYTFHNENAKGFYREGNGRYAPYNLFTKLRETATLATLRKPARPADYFTWGTAQDLPRGKKATGMDVSFGHHTTVWKYADKGWVNESTYAGKGDEFPADTVLVLRVQVGDAGYKDPGGNFVPEIKFAGKGGSSGAAQLFHAGRVVNGTWSKKDLTAPFELRTKAGELKVPAGHVWVELVPVQGGGVSVTR